MVGATFAPTPLGLSCGSPSPLLWSLRRCSVRLWLCRSLALGRPRLCHSFYCRLFARLRGLGLFVFLRGQVFGQFGQFRHLLDKFSNNWWTNFGPVLDQIGPSRGQDGPKRAIKSFKDPKRCICTNSEDLLSLEVFGVQGGPRQPQKAQNGHPKCAKRAPKPQEKGIQKWTPFIPTFKSFTGTISGYIMGPELTPKLDQKWDRFS